ncbi:MAG: TetR/AcrR family transcriptional regulator [Candidatus Aminicenantes bacterium]|nr:TetR/AcrR family transcriptional regulator [Candidatus Aminicenantes bacterium]
MAKIVNKELRKAGIVEAAAKVFAERGVAKTAVSDIAGAASVAQGTIYLYFKDKDDILLAVVQSIVDRMMDGIERLIASPGASAVERLRSLGSALGAAESDPAARELSAILHRPENRLLHDRMAEGLTPRLLAVMDSIVRQGIEENSFSVPDPHAAAWFVLGGLQSVELSGTPQDGMPVAIDKAIGFALRALGFKEPEQ